MTEEPRWAHSLPLALISIIMHASEVIACSPILLKVGPQQSWRCLHAQNLKDYVILRKQFCFFPQIEELQCYFHIVVQQMNICVPPVSRPGCSSACSPQNTAGSVLWKEALNPCSCPCLQSPKSSAPCPLQLAFLCPVWFVGLCGAHALHKDTIVKPGPMGGYLVYEILYLAGITVRSRFPSTAIPSSPHHVLSQL